MKSRRCAASLPLIAMLLPIGVGLFVATGSVQAFAQTTPPYETKLYRPSKSSLEKNYGLPSFAMPGSELPKQRTMGTPQPDATDPDFLAGLGAKPKNDDERDALAAPSDGAETPDRTTPDVTDTPESGRNDAADKP